MDDKIVDPDVRLITPSISHARTMFNVVSESRNHLEPWMGWVSGLKHVSDTENFLSDAVYTNDIGVTAIMLIEYKGSLVGTVSLEELNTNNRSAVLGYWISHHAQKQGVISRSAKVLVDHGFEVMDLNRLVARCAIHNRRSRRVIERLGFSLEGILRQNERIGESFYDQFCFGLLKSDWKTNEMIASGVTS